MNQDKLGCYRVGNLKFYSKLEAIEMHVKTGIHPHWDFNETVFSSYDWTVEPAESLAELYRRRAQQLRDKYDYIILMYSSGADSNSILNTFVNNNIKLDEVASYINYEATSDKNDSLNNEIFNIAHSRIKKIQETHTWLKHRIIDQSQFQIDYFTSKEARFDWIYSMNMFFNANCTARQELGLKVKEWADLINQGKKLCILWGHDKPRLIYSNNRFSIRFLDIIDGGPTVKSIAGQNPYADELFYWTPDLPEIIIKQGHVVKNYLKTHWASSPYISLAKTDLPYIEINGVKHWITHDGLHLLIYPSYKIGESVWAKPRSTIISARDVWFNNMENSNRAKQVWKMGVDKLFDLLPNYWKNNPTDLSAGLKGCWSKDYYLEKV